MKKTKKKIVKPAEAKAIAKEVRCGEFFKPSIVKNKKGKGAYDRKDHKRLS